MNNYEEQLKTELKIIDKDNRTLQQENIYLREKCKQLQTTAKEVREYIEEMLDNFYNDNFIKQREKLKNILEILDKGSEYLIDNGTYRGGMTIRLDKNGNVIHCK